MKLAFNIVAADFIVDQLETTCEITLENGKITSSHLILTAKIAGIGKEKFDELVKDAEKNCPISVLLDTSITVDASLTA